MAYTTINKSTDYFNTKLYTGNGTARDIDVGFDTDLVWIKRRNGTANHRLTDRVRGATNMLSSNNTNATQTDAQTVTGFITNGFSLGTDSGGYDVNTNSNTYASWNWKANGAGSANTDGSINSTVSVNTTAGFSIVSYTGNATAGATIGHGLGSAPSMIIAKRRSAVEDWGIYHQSMGASKYINLNTTAAEQSSTSRWNGTEPTSSVFSVNTHGSVNGSGDTYIAYCFAEKQGYSKFGSYVGNGNADGSFIYTGFKPAFVMVKKSSASGSDWNLHDNKRPGFNVNNSYLAPNENAAEVTGNTYQIFDLLSNGFKCRGAGTGTNASGETMIYMAFAESPFVGNNFVPNNAR